MTSIFASGGTALTLRLVTAEASADMAAALPEALRPLAAGFEGKPGQVVRFPSGSDSDAWLGIGPGKDVFAIGAAAKALAGGDWQIEALPEGWDPTLTATAWALGGYSFTLYKPADREPARLVLPEGADAAEAEAVVRAVTLTRDLVNTPADRMGPEGLENAFRSLAERFDATVRVVRGDDLLAQNYPMIHAVGRAAGEAPRLLELEWGEESHPRVAVVGKGVCFDSGGLDLKAAQFMRLMKKDMGGAANAMGLASMIMAAGLPVRLHLLVPAVENAVGAGAFRPGDILTSRKGITVEVDNTDAEGRLVLADALTRATEEKVDLLLDFATLTGAARVALGPEVAPFYTDQDDLAADLAGAAVKVFDPVWRMPLWDGYEGDIDGEISDIVNSTAMPMAGSITAGLFLRRFVGDAAWMHFDIFAWNPKERPGRPKGGDMHAARAVYQMLKERFQD
ncbi:leucyl aminopeptidase family protein [Maricaulis virginensis]|uniref:Leucyl aminopeptidase n=1 Tax=Maricaulis virginensis TaxID=144022 RepID=A0A9W6IKL9_9PROT|nr:leucyl aminopeptidase family protein [Maricaulis virginensis]GLK51993.1 leucyl aminopeptidase [Maricaulis virginensis]